MGYYVRFFASKAHFEKGNPLGQTEMNFNYTPEIAEEISLSFPAAYLKHNKWFGLMPRKPFTIGNIYQGVGGDYEIIEAFYTGERFDFDQIR